ncbi:MAG: ferritin-like domain-containing protein [Myxococcales bacterium]|nr:ferritin-like domain-containing protein [Myxococcales bacterium]
MRSHLALLRASVLVALGLPAIACGADSEETGKSWPCTDSMPFPGDPALSMCSEGTIHRTATAQCPNSLPRPETCTPTGGGSSECSADTDCTAKPHGLCGVKQQVVDCVCFYGCVTDADCDAGSVCVCGQPAGYCFTASCATDADCGAGALCAQARLEKCGSFGFRCQRGGDQCAQDSDCAPGQQCAVSGGLAKCQENDCPVPGRPFFVDDAARVAAVVERADWCSDFRPRVKGLTGGERAALAAHWAKVGQMEHASVAAFARFTLQLLALGAPAALVRDSQEAMADELRHAQTAFGLASAYSGSQVGPAALDVSGALGGEDVASIVRLTFREGCVGESAAAHEARVSAESAADPVVRGVLEDIGADEERHALLAWKLVRWAFDCFGTEARDAVRAEVARLEAEAALAPAPEGAFAAHGVFDEAARLALRAEAVRAVVLPCAEALFAEAGSSGEGAHNRAA